MQKIQRDDAKKFAFDWRDEPLLRVQPGESFEIETWDASSGFFKTPEDKAIPANRPGFGVPVPDNGCRFAAGMSHTTTTTFPRA